MRQRSPGRDGDSEDKGNGRRQSGEIVAVIEDKGVKGRQMTQGKQKEIEKLTETDADRGDKGDKRNSGKLRQT